MKNSIEKIAEIKEEMSKEFSRAAKVTAQMCTEETYWEIKDSYTENGVAPGYNQSGIVDWAQDYLSIYQFPDWEKEYGMSREEIEEMFGGEENLINIAVSADKEVWRELKELVELKLEEEETRETVVSVLSDFYSNYYKEAVQEEQDKGESFSKEKAKSVFQDILPELLKNLDEEQDITPEEVEGIFEEGELEKIAIDEYRYFWNSLK